MVCCIAARLVSSLIKGKAAWVGAMAQEDDCLAERFVLVLFVGRLLGAPLPQWQAVKADLATRAAVEDWRYWLARGYVF